MSKLVSDRPSSQDWQLTVSLDCFGLIFFSAGQIPKQSGIEIACVSQAMPILPLGPFQLEGRRRPFAGMTLPPVDEQDTIDIQKQHRDRNRSFHAVSST